MQSWIKIVPVEQTTQGKEYFIGRQSAHCCDFWSRDKAGRERFTSKPGIAIRYEGGARLVSDFKRNEKIKLVAIEVPANADKRWSRR